MDGGDRQRPRHKWTVMVYLAGDNNLESYGGLDLLEMKAGGPSDDVAVLAQFDRRSDQIVRRYRLTVGGDLDADCAAVLPEVNCGDPAALADFVLWSARMAPAERYALVLWNHGGGWKDDDIYAVAREQGAADQMTSGTVRGLSSGRLSRTLFRPSMDALVEAASRGILYDDSAADFLDSVELRYALATIRVGLGQPLDLLGCDACLMSMIEVAWQVQGLCRVLVGSQEIEPGEGWRYDHVVARLVGQPNLDAAGLGRAIVESYCAAFAAAPHLSVTQSALELDRLRPVAEQVSRLGAALAGRLGDDATLGLIFRALRSVQRFSDRDYVDLDHLCRLLAAALTGEAGDTAGSVLDLLSGPQSPIVAEGHSGPNVRHAAGLSIHFPARSLSPLYQRLEFARDWQWYDFLNAFCPS